MFKYTNFPIYAGSSASSITQHTFTDTMHYRIFSSWMITCLWWWKTTFKCKCISMKVNQECNSFSCNLTVSKPTPVLISQRFAPVHHQPNIIPLKSQTRSWTETRTSNIKVSSHPAPWKQKRYSIILLVPKDKGNQGFLISVKMIQFTWQHKR